MEQEAYNQRKNMLCTVDRIEGRLAVLKLEDGQSLDWPIEKLPSDAHEGMAVKLFLSTAKTEEEEREKNVKTVLNELLKTE
ncbi:hypothetical protein A3H03_00850 [Candidatus Kuenenbacteria bacterium RIFCSPLOWO2_12_FULL_42_13]|uniref:DUF3006 domain-containing protein n=5 Tax=Candidatus Kueneniibacteriota TaxID=1752740 RepID=A0A0G0Z3F0_9BACT|nr:MAG: hypothetical protein UV02_C0003G0004 [Candidatus Kuenenbacteria bacterium GW2011_GWA2_42_15]OGG89485.1 MAG: hypothetical protein A3C68_00325 [Candidatus Kuenenbacteria bacterium RIFCSPHIGHO2_02_FULL_42_29]OGG90624.1 MAG: hypothetical protein A3H55_00490 [Candidatus Kuenenbacteria bacterium RIFCSPLOWO2_02_FULL_42_16]OGG92445.1 MAG: hypothetical protein A3H03_00850 [Candidatus Kuenenbacteria bacterium RIFCSPLOWO2_12_FULL_42_13]OGG95708.1 MAG: hypothetical protein A2V95_00700 [Candidatus K